MSKKKRDNWLNFKNIMHYAFDDIWTSMWKFLLRRQNRFHRHHIHHDVE